MIGPEYCRAGYLLLPRQQDGKFIPDPDPAPCRNCDGSRAGKRRGKCGLCATCWRRWSGAGYPATGVPEPRHSGPVGGTEGYLGRVEDYQILRRERGLSAAEAALALGLTRRTLQRYEAAIRSGAA